MTARLASCVLALVISGSGCAAGYVYLPVGSGGAAVARYPVPPAAPQGEVYVTSFGLTDIEVAPRQTARMLHARVAVSNASPVTWTVDGQQQLLVLPGRAPQAPVFLNSDAGAGPTYQVFPDHSNVFDLYYAMPPPLDQEAALGGFDLDWRVDLPGLPIAQRTPFQRTAGPPPAYDPYPPYVAVGLGFGVGWWYGPGYFHARRYPPVIHRYYYPPMNRRGGAWRGAPPGAWRGTPPGWRGSPSPPPRMGGGGWRGSPPAAAPRPGGGWRGSPPSAPRSAPSRGGGWRGR